MQLDWIIVFINKIEMFPNVKMLKNVEISTSILTGEIRDGHSLKHFLNAYQITSHSSSVKH